MSSCLDKLLSDIKNPPSYWVCRDYAQKIEDFKQRLSSYHVCKDKLLDILRNLKGKWCN